MKQLFDVGRISAIIALIISYTTFISCDNDNDFNLDGKIAFSVNGERYEIDLTSTEEVNLTTLSTEFNTEFEFYNAKSFTKLAVNGIDVPKSNKLSLHIDKISKNEKIKISYSTNDRNGQITLNTLHNNIPEMEVEGKAKIDGDFYFSYSILRLILKCDNDGNITFYRHEPFNITDKDIMNGWWDFKKHTYNGKTYYSYHAHDPNFTDIGFPGYNPGMRVLLDERYRTIKTIHLEESRDKTVKKGHPIDGHDFYFFSPDHYILSSYIDRNIGGRVLSVSYLQEVKDGKVIFDWWSSDHKETLSWTNENFDTSYDYIHFNSIQVLPDGNWLCSFRHICSIMKIDRVGKTGDIIWRIAGNELDEKYRFFGQHYATLHNDNTLTLFDNGNGHTPAKTRILRLTIDPNNGSVVGGGDILANNDGYFAMACGSAQLIDNGYIVGWGIPGNANGSHNRLVAEYNSAGEKIFEVNQMGEYLNNVLRASYRCVKYK